MLLGFRRRRNFHRDVLLRLGVWASLLVLCVLLLRELRFSFHYCILVSTDFPLIFH